jgi:hypothetical protein
MHVRVITLEVGFTRINVPFVRVIKIVLNSFYSHGVPIFTTCSFIINHLIDKQYAIQPQIQCEPIGRMVIGESYQ